MKSIHSKNMTNPFEKIVITPQIEKIDDQLVPPPEILRPNEQTELVTNDQIKEVIDSLKNEGEEGLMKNFLRRWGQRGLLALTLVSTPGSSATEATILDQQINDPKNKLENFQAEQPEFQLPETFIYAHCDDRTNALEQYISGHDALPESMKEEIVVRSFINDVMEMGLKIQIDDDNTSHTYNEILGGMQSRIKAMKEPEFKNYLSSKDYLKDMVDHEIITLPEYYLKDHPLKSVGLNGKIDYLKKYQMSLFGDKEARDVKKISDQEFLDQVFSKNNDFLTMTEMFIKNNEFSAKRYNTFWTTSINKDSETKIDLSYEFSDRMGNQARAYYCADIDKMFLGFMKGENQQKNLLTKWVHEMPHVIQKQQGDLTDAKQKLEYAKDLQKFFASTGTNRYNFDQEKFNKWYDENTYNDPEHIEYKAHKEIQPEFEKEVADIF